jgi:hypothetical protein
MVRRMSIAAGFLLASTACGATYKATLTKETVMPDGSSLGLEGGHMHSGIATLFTPAVSKDDVWGNGNDSDPIVLTSSNPAVLQVASVPASGDSSATEDSESSQTGRWIVWAVAPGWAVLTVETEGNVAANIPVEVIDPPN